MLIIDSRIIWWVVSSPGGNRRSGACNLVTHFFFTVAQLAFSLWHFIGIMMIFLDSNSLIFALYRETIVSVFMIMFVILRVNGNYRIVVMDFVDIKQFAFVGFFSFINEVGTMIPLNYLILCRYAILQPNHSNCNIVWS